MLLPGARTGLRAGSATASSSCRIALTQRAQQSPWQHRCLSTTPTCQSRMGRTAISIPPSVDVNIGEPIIHHDATTYLKIARRTITVKGPLGVLNYDIPPYIQIDHDTEQRTATLSIEDTKVREQREMWGTSRAYLQNHIQGVSEGHTAILRLVGVGYRATVERRDRFLEQYPDQKSLVLKLGFAHAVEEPIPLGITVSVASPTRVLMEGIDKEQVMSFAAHIRKWRPPEPYKGKGIFINDQTIKLKGKKGK